MSAETEATSAGGVARVFAIVLLLLGAFTMGASAATSGFDLGEDLELGRAVHDVDGGPVLTWIAAVVLLVLAGVAVANPILASRLLVWVAVGAPVLTVVTLAVLAVVDDDRPVATGFGAGPFVIAFFSVPAFVTSVLLRQGGETTTGHGSGT